MAVWNGGDGGDGDLRLAVPLATMAAAVHFLHRPDINAISLDSTRPGVL